MTSDRAARLGLDRDLDLMWKMAFRDYQLTSKAKSVGMAIHGRVDGNTLTCWPSIERLAQDTGLSERAVKLAVSELVEHRVITKTRRASDSNLYMLQPPGQWVRREPVRS